MQCSKRWDFRHSAPFAPDAGVSADGAAHDREGRREMPARTITIDACVVRHRRACSAATLTRLRLVHSASVCQWRVAVAHPRRRQSGNRGFAGQIRPSGAEPCDADVAAGHRESGVPVSNRALCASMQLAAQSVSRDPHSGDDDKYHRRESERGLLDRDAKDVRDDHGLVS
jgi:hypothetical protein